jgi:hypothetical protein
MLSPEIAPFVRGSTREARSCCYAAVLNFTPGDQQDMSQECGLMRQLAADKTLTPVQLADIRKNMDKTGCSIIP